MVFQLKGQAEYLRDIGMQVVLVSSEGPEWSMINTGNGLDVEIINIPRQVDPWNDLIALIRLTKLFLKHRFDIVHSTTPKAGLLTALAAFIARVPIRIHTFTGQPWVTLKGFIRYASRMADRLIGALSTKCYADSHSQIHFLVKEGIFAPGKISIIGQGSLAGIDMERFNPGNWSLTDKQKLRRGLGIAESSKVIVFIGRISPDKGIAELISAFYKLVRLKYDVHLLLVGPQDQDCGGISSLDLSSTKQCLNIHCVGFTECPENYLSIADIYCLPSYREGLPHSVLEAAAMGLPTVATDIYGVTDAVVDGETGILVPPRDEHSLLVALKRLLDHSDESIKMGKAVRTRCLRCFDSVQVNASTAEEYAKLLKLP